MGTALKRVGQFIGVLLLVLLLWGLIEPYLIDVERYDVAIDNLPAEWEGRRIALVADWQIGMWLDNSSTVKRAVERIVDERPAAAVIAGDFIYHVGQRPREELEEVAAALRPLGEAGIPTFAVLGNHDYALASDTAKPNLRLARAVDSTLESLGIHVLHNEAVPIAGDSSLYVVGVGSRWAERDRVQTALAGLPSGAARVAVMHHPDSYLKFPPHTAPLAMAGHTHGGQIQIPLTPTWSWLLYTQKDTVHAAGWIRRIERPGNRLYVNRGIGFSLLPLRINCMPELTFFTLQRP